MSSRTTKLATLAVIGATAAGGAAIASAATSGSGTTGTQATPPASARGHGGSGTPPGGGPPGGMRGGRHSVGGRTEAPLSGETAARVRAAALKKVSGSVERVETNVDGSVPYEAHIRKSDGSEVEVQVSRDFAVVAVNRTGMR